MFGTDISISPFAVDGRSARYRNTDNIG